MTCLLPPFVATARGRLACSSSPLPHVLCFAAFACCIGLFAVSLGFVTRLRRSCFASLCFSLSCLRHHMRMARRRQAFGCDSTKRVMRRLCHAASFAIRRAVRFRNREAATPGPRSMPQRCPPLVRPSGKAHSPPTNDRDMRRADEASRPRGEPDLFPLRACGSPELRCGPRYWRVQPFRVNSMRRT